MLRPPKTFRPIPLRLAFSLLLAGTATASYALGLGPAQGQAVIGQTLDIEIPLIEAEQRAQMREAQWREALQQQPATGGAGLWQLLLAVLGGC